jgi:hypothetical protein
MAAVVGVLLLCSSSSAVAAFMMGGDKDKPAPASDSAPAADPAPATDPAPAADPAPATDPAPAADPSPPPEPASTSVGSLEGYADFENLEIKPGSQPDGDTCQDDTSLNACKTQCNYDGRCTAFTYDAEAKKCCLTSGVSGVKYNKNVVTFVKTIPKYDVVSLGGRAGGNIKNGTTVETVEECANECEKNNSCVGFSFSSGKCQLKKESGLASRYTETGFQFYERKDKPEPGLNNVRYVRLERPSANYPNNIINIAEVEIFDKDGNNVAKGKSVTGGPGSAHSAGPYKRLTDGNLSNFAHTTGNGRSHIQIDLGSSMNIRNMVITNRQDCCKQRTGNMILKFLDRNKEEIFVTSEVAKSKNKMKMDFSEIDPKWTY